LHHHEQKEGKMMIHQPTIFPQLNQIVNPVLYEVEVDGRHIAPFMIEKQNISSSFSPRIRNHL
jgi:hypothetical protein